MEERVQAIALFSGGLDSRLAVMLVARQDIEVICYHFRTGFEHAKNAGEKLAEMKEFCKRQGHIFREIPLREEALRVVQSPRFGHGRHLNPCVDCKILMLQKTRENMEGEGASFVITGEVLGQRPMSQHEPSLHTIERESGLEGLLLRPLSARKLPPTIPEKKGWVNRELLCDFSGRTRKPQMELARSLGVEHYPPPAGGCLLTDPRYSHRLRDLLDHPPFDMLDMELLKVGRHFRLSSCAKLVVARHREENERLLQLKKPPDRVLFPVNRRGPVGIGRGEFDFETEEIASRIIVRYSKFPDTSPRVIMEETSGEKREFSVESLSDQLLESLRI